MTTLSCNELYQAHRQSGAIATIAAHARRVNIDLGVLQMDGLHRLTGCLEKPSYDLFVSMGMYMFEPRLLQYIPYNEYLDFPDLVLKLIAHGEHVHGYRFDGY